MAVGLAEHGRVLALDLAGFGLTPRAGRSAGLEGNRQLLSRFLGATETRPAVLVGHSMGGGLALLQAAHEPESVRALVLSSSFLPPSRAGVPDRTAFAFYIAHRLRMRARALARTRGQLPTLERVVSASLRGGAANPASIDPALMQASVELAGGAQPVGETARAFAQAARSTFRLLSHGAEFRRLLDRIECPVLLLHGGRDRTVPLAFAERAAHDHPAWKLEVFPELGHVLQLEAPERWLAAVSHWLENLDRDRSAAT